MAVKAEIEIRIQ